MVKVSGTEEEIKDFIRSILNCSSNVDIKICSKYLGTIDGCVNCVCTRYKKIFIIENEKGE